MLQMDVPRDRIHLEDIELDRWVGFGHKVVDRTEIIAFAKAFDPQPMHLDEDAARRSIVGGLCASGFHSCAMMMRMLVDDVLVHATSLGSPGFEEVRWLRPVRPDDVLSARFKAIEKRTLGSKPEVGIARIQFEMRNKKDEVLMTWDANQLLRVRHPRAAGLVSAERATSGPKEPVTSLWDLPGPEPRRDANHFEHRRVGETYALGSHTFDREGVLAFARAFDPQPFHLDDAAAEASLFGRLSASGWHTTAIWIRQFVAWRQQIEAQMREKGLQPAVYGPSPGFKSIRWLKPVHPGDTIEYRGRIAETLDWRSRPDRGLIVTDNQGRNQRGEIVFAIRGQIFAERRTPLA